MSLVSFMHDISVEPGKGVEMDLWADFMEKAAYSNAQDIQSKPYICRKILPGEQRFQRSLRSLSLMTQKETDLFFKGFGKWHANCVKMQFVDVIRLSRIYLSHSDNQERKKRVVEALRIMAAKAEAKYEKDWLGTARKIFCWICNLFISTRSIQLFQESYFVNSKNDHVPFFVGTDATFAKLVADCYSTQIDNGNPCP